VELHLPELVDCFRRMPGDVGELPLAQIRQEVCSRCPLHGGADCPCPMAYLAVLIAEAMETSSERLEQWERLRRRLPRPPANPRVPVAEIQRAYEEATGTCLGCD
jgi:hypothetical protein